MPVRMERLRRTLTRQWGNRALDLALVAGLVMGFPALCPVPLDRQSFLSASFRPDQWEWGVTREHGSGRGYCVQGETCAIGPVAWHYSRYSFSAVR